MKRSNMKTADDIIVPDAEAGMRRLAEATRHILTVPKSDTRQVKLRKPRKHKS